MTHDSYSTGPVSTEWEDALVKHKIIERAPKPKTQDVLDTEHMWKVRDKEQHKYDNLNMDELNKLEDELEETELEILRKKRLLELEKEKEKNKYGSVRQISKSDYEREVTNASQNNQVVLCCLFAFGQEDSKLMLNALSLFASRRKDVKVVKIQGQECIENYPDKFCPTLVIYKNGDPVGNIKGVKPFGGKNISSDIIEWELYVLGLIKTELESNPRQFKINNLSKKNSTKNSYSKHNHNNRYYQQQNEEDEDSEDSLDI